MVPDWAAAGAFIFVIALFFITFVDWKDKGDIIVGGGFCAFLVFVVICGFGMR